MIKEVNCYDCEFAISNFGSDYSGYDLGHYWHYTNVSAILESAARNISNMFYKTSLPINKTGETDEKIEAYGEQLRFEYMKLMD